MKQLILWISLVNFLLACDENRNNSNSSHTTEKEQLAYEIRMTLEHNPNAFTQGLVFYKDRLIESTGGDSSWIAEYNIEKANYVKKVELNQNFFGEGITVLNDKIYQLTWKNKVGFVYDAKTFEKIDEFEYDFEGWGITNDGQHLIISDGTEKLHYFDTLNLVEEFTKSIQHKGRNAFNLNELEFIEGYVYANQWESSYILKIDPDKAEVVKEYDFGYLERENKRKKTDADVLNGIAYNPETKDVFITGKLWPHLYILRFKE